jgi:hypothetical protein
MGSSNRVNCRGSGLDPVDGGIGMFAEELDPRSFDARVVRGCFDQVQEPGDRVVEPALQPIVGEQTSTARNAD